MKYGSVLAAAILLAGCASPVVTRVNASAPALLPQRASFAFAPAPDDGDALSGQARDMVAAALHQRGWRQAAQGDYLLAVTLADRPATIALKAGDDLGKPVATLAPAADRSNNKGCARRDHRLTITLTDRSNGAIAFSGAASEYHCKAALYDTLPYLVSAAVDRFDAGSGTMQFARKGKR